MDRIRDAAAVWNGAGANVFLSEVASDGLADIHIHGDSTSACGGGAIGCAQIAWYVSHSGTYADGDLSHLIASNMDVLGTVQEMTMLTRSDWYTDASAGGIMGFELDYMTVAIQEFGHQLGLGHNSGAIAHPDSALSPMNGSLPSGTVRRILQPTDLAAIQHLYGASATSAVPEPSSLSLMVLAGCFVAGGILRRRKNKQQSRINFPV